VKTGAVRDLHSFPFPARAVAWLPDGSGVLVVGTDDQNPRGQIFLVSYPRGALSRFTNDLTDYDPCCLEIRRDGNALATLAKSVVSDVWVAKADASDARQITSGEPLGLGLQWVGSRIAAATPDAKWAAFNDDGSNRARLMSDGDVHLQLTSCLDGKHMIYTTARTSGFDLWRRDTDGSNPLRLLSLAIIGGAICTPDSKWVLYAADDGYWRLPLDGGTPTKTDLPFVASLGYSRDGNLMFYLSQKVEGDAMQTRLAIAPASGKQPLRSLDVPYGMQSLQFTPDSKAVAFLLTRDHATNIWEQPVAGGEPIQLTRFPSGDIFAFSWSSDGRQLAFSRGVRKTDVVMMSNLR
jgi:Tol biopolymer transport system component